MGGRFRKLYRASWGSTVSTGVPMGVPMGDQGDKCARTSCLQGSNLFLAPSLSSAPYGSLWRAKEACPPTFGFHPKTHHPKLCWVDHQPKSNDFFPPFLHYCPDTDCPHYIVWIQIVPITDHLPNNSLFTPFKSILKHTFGTTP